MSGLANITYSDWLQAIIGLLATFLELLPITLFIALIFGTIGLLLGMLQRATRKKVERF